MSVLLLLLLSSSPPAPLHEQAFRLERPSEAVAVIQASCERCDWGARGREAAVLALSVDGAPPQHVLLARGRQGEYRVLLGALGEGDHRLALAKDARWSARGTGAVRVESVRVEAVPADAPGHEALAHAPIVHARKGSLERFSDAPLVAWVETLPAADGGRELRYSVVFSHEDGGTPLDRLMATWGRAADIELVYAVELDAAGGLRRAQYQGKDHVMTAFAGRREGRHPVLYVVTKNNMLSDRGPATPRMALAPVAFSLDGVSREAVMDAHPWTHEVSAAEVRREGLVVDGAAPGLEADPGPASLRLPRGLWPRERRAARLRRRAPGAERRRVLARPRTPGARPSVSRGAAASGRPSRSRAERRSATCGPCACAPTPGLRAATSRGSRAARAPRESSA